MDNGLVEKVARAMAAALLSQDMEAIAPENVNFLKGSLALPWIDQGETDCGTIARAVIPVVMEHCAGEYICKCGLRVEPHRCRDTQGEF